MNQAYHQQAMHMPYSQPSISSSRSIVPRYASNTTLAMGSVGAIVGGTVAAAKNMRRVKDHEITRQEAVKGIVKEAAGAGVATAAAAVVARSVGARGIWSLVAVFAVAAGTKYVWDAAVGGGK